ncbi:MAG: type I glyceraldehyde-3-phosphate dehydrogenase [Nitrospiria bacterium]
MGLRVAINGFGRIGRNLFRAAHGNPSFDLVAVNDLSDAKTLAHLLQYDSVHGRFNHEVRWEAGAIIVDGQTIRISNERDPGALPWKAERIDLVVEATGRFVDRDAAKKHIEAGAKKVIVSAPAKKPDITIVLGVNEDTYDPSRHHILSNASCTTNCLAPVAKVLMEKYGIVHGLMTTVHSYTNDQQLLDFPHKDLRRARAAAHSMIPTTTGAAKALSEVIPELTGKLDGMAIRVPTPNVSIVDLVATLNSDTDASDIRHTLKDASESKLSGILQYTEEPLVSIDLNGNPHSSIVDGTLTKVIGKRMAKIIAWYDNEWGYSCRLSDLIRLVANRAS